MTSQLLKLKLDEKLPFKKAYRFLPTRGSNRSLLKPKQPIESEFFMRAHAVVRARKLAAPRHSAYRYCRIEASPRAKRAVTKYHDPKKSCMQWCYSSSAHQGCEWVKSWRGALGANQPYQMCVSIIRWPFSIFGWPSILRYYYILLSYFNIQ